MQLRTKHSHTSPVLHLGFHNFGSLLRSRKAVRVSKKTSLLFAWMILVMLLVGLLPADARQLAKLEAEQATVGTWGAVVNDTTASGGKALRWNTSGTTGTLKFTISEPATSVSVYIKAGSNSSSRMCVRPKVDNVALGTQPLCVSATQRTYVGRTFATNLAAGSHTLTLTGSEISGTDRLFADYTSFDTSTSPPPEDPYAKPNTTSQTFEEGWTPAANSVHLNPRITCSADPTPANVANAERGVNIVNENVVLINPQIKGCSVGILVRAGGFKLLADKSKVGYASAASPALHNNYQGRCVRARGLRLRGQGAERRRAVHEEQLHPRQPTGGLRVPDRGHRHRPPHPPGLGPHREVVREPSRQGRHQGPRRLYQLCP